MQSKPLPPTSKPYLGYTIAFDEPGDGSCRQMAKMLAASMARTYFGGDFLVIRNSPTPLFLVQKEGISEYFVDTGSLDGKELAHLAVEWKALAYEKVFRGSVDDYSWVLFLDADCLALRNLDHLFDSRDDDTDICYQPEPRRSIHDPVFHGYLEPGWEESLACDGINSGTLAVRAHAYPEVAAEWLRIQRSEPLQPTEWREQSAWNRLVLDAEDRGWGTRRFEAHEIQFPLHLDPEWKRYKQAALVHCIGGTNQEKIEFMFGMYMQKFFHDSKGTFVALLDM